MNSEGSLDKQQSVGTLERLGTAIDSVRGLGTKAWKLGVLMAKGAYLIGERRRLFLKLGEEVYEKIRKGELQNSDLEPLVHQLDRMTKKVEIEEILIRRLRFETRDDRPPRPETKPETKAEDHV